MEPDSSQREEVQMFKSIINEHKRQIEIKDSSMPWDSRLVIITANISVNELTNACSSTCKEAVYRRLSVPFKPKFILPGEFRRYCIYLIKVISKVFQVELRPNEVYEALEPVLEDVSDVESELQTNVFTI